MKLISGLLSIFIVMPIWYYLLYKILEGVHATELMWFLYFIFLPAGIFIRILTSIAESKEK